MLFADFNIFFTDRLRNKPFLIWLLTHPPHLKDVPTLPCSLSSIAFFSGINISQGSVARYLTCDGTFTYQFVANLSQPVSERIWKLVNIWGSYGKQFSVFFDTLCTCYSNVLDELYNLNSDIWDIHVITSALKLFFRELPEPVISYELCDQFLRANGK